MAISLLDILSIRRHVNESLTPVCREDLAQADRVRTATRLTLRASNWACRGFELFECAQFRSLLLPKRVIRSSRLYLEVSEQ